MSTSRSTTAGSDDTILRFPDDHVAAAAFLVPRVGYEVAERLMYDAAATGRSMGATAARHRVGRG